jgi:hypothetical protein
VQNGDQVSVIASRTLRAWIGQEWAALEDDG